MGEVLRGASIAFALKLLGVALGFGFNLLMARLLGAHGTGIYYLSLTVITTASVFGRLGLGNALLRFVADHADRQNWSGVAGVYRQGIRVAVAASTVATGVVILAAPWIARQVFSEPALTTPLRLMAFSIWPLSLANIYAELLRALKRVRDTMFIQAVGIPLISLAVLGVIGGTFQALGAAMAYLAGTLGVLGFGYVMWRKSTPHIRRVRGTFDTRLLIATGIPLFWISLLHIVMEMADTALLGIWVASDRVGIYGVAMRAASMTSFILMAINTIVAPKFAALYAQGEHRSLGSLARNAAKLTTLLASPMLLLFILVPETIMGLFGQEFVGGARPLTILAFGQFVNVACGSVGYLLMMTGHEKAMRNNLLFSAILKIGLNILLITQMGIIGAALATAISIAFMNLFAAYLVYRKLSIFTLPLPRWLLKLAGFTIFIER